MNSKSIRILMFVAMIVGICSIISGCGKSKKSTPSNENVKVATSIEVVSIDDKYTINNNEIHMLYGEDISLAKHDFCIIVNFDDNSSLTIEENFEFSTNITQNSNVGEYKLEFRYEDFVNEIKVYINSIDLRDENIVVNEIENYEYTGSEIKPNISLKFKDNALLEGYDYDLEYINNINASGNAVVKIYGKGNFEGELTKNFVISPKVLEVGDWIYANEYIYNGSEYIVKLSNIPHELNVEYINNKNIDAETYLAKANLSVKPEYNTNNYIIPTVRDLVWEIKPKSLALAEITGESALIYTGQDIEPEVEVKINNIVLIKDIDYIVTYSNNLNITNNAQVVITGKGNYVGEKVYTFAILPKTVNINSAWNYPNGGFVYCGKNYEVNLIDIPECVDITYTNNSAVNAGSYTAIAEFELKEGYNNYSLSTTSTTLSWTINHANILDCIVGEIPTQIYTGSAVEPKLTIKHLIYNSETLLEDKLIVLKEGVDYTLSYYNNINEGSASVTVNGLGNYANKTIKIFEIEKRLDESDYLWPTELLQSFGISLSKPTFGKVVSVISNEGLEIVLENIDQVLFEMIISSLYNNDEFVYSEEDYEDLDDLIIYTHEIISFSAKNSDEDSYVLCDVSCIIKESPYYEYPVNSIIFKIEKY